MFSCLMRHWGEMYSMHYVFLKQFMFMFMVNECSLSLYNSRCVNSCIIYFICIYSMFNGEGNGLAVESQF